MTKFLLPFCLVIGGITSVCLGQDANWDLKNYHLYNAFAFLHDRMHTDLFAAGMQTYFHPVLDIPYYLMSMQVLSGHPRILAFVMGMPYGVLIFLVFLIAANIISAFEDNKPVVYAVSAAATLFGATGSATISQTGTTFNEIPVVVLLLAGLLPIISGFKTHRDANDSTLWLAGLLFGAAAGLKLTAAIYAPAAATAIFFTAKHRRRGFMQTAFFCTGWVVAFMLVWGWWGWKLYELTGNPVFPMFNSIFHSPWIAERSGMDYRFKPDFLMQAIFYPFYWMSEGPMTVAEPEFSDPRFAIGFIGFFGLTASLWLTKRMNGASRREADQPVNAACMNPAVKFLLIFVFVGYIVWEALFSILRYAAILESLLGVIVFSLLILIARKARSRFRFAFLGTALSITIGLSVVLTSYPTWGRVEYSDQVFRFSRTVLPENSLVLFFSKPVAYCAPFISRDNPGARFVGIEIEPAAVSFRDYDLGRHIAGRIASHEGPVYVVAFQRDLEDMHDMLAEYGLSSPRQSSVPLTSNIDEDLFLYPLHKGGIPTHPYRLGRTIAFDGSSSGLEFLAGGWSRPESWGCWSDAPISSIALPLKSARDSDLLVSFSSRAFITAKHPELTVEVSANGIYLDTLLYRYPRDSQDRIRTVLIPRIAAEAKPHELELKFSFNNSTSPRALGVSDDERMLGIGLVWMKVSSAAP